MGIVALLIAVCVLVGSRGAAWATVSVAVGTLGTFLLFLVGAVVQVVFAGGGVLTAVCVIPQTIANVVIAWSAYQRSRLAA